MPSGKNLLAAASRVGLRSTLPVLLPLATRWACADHGVPAPPRGGFGWLSWLLVAGAVVAVGLAAWAFFAPDDQDKAGETAPANRPRVEPPIR